jgi:multisite-specific tRNA:(cytosine-C5)-methyltransferase
VGGRIVYSTCSMNPVENEAVVAEILRRCGDSVELLDVSNELPELVRRPGLSTWKVSVHFSESCIFPCIFCITLQFCIISCDCDLLWP